MPSLLSLCNFIRQEPKKSVIKETSEKTDCRWLLNSIFLFSLTNIEGVNKEREKCSYIVFKVCHVGGREIEKRRNHRFETNNELEAVQIYFFSFFV